MKRIIYDLGANNGDDLPYYMKKSELVVAVEANPMLADGIRRRFREEMEQGRLVVESCVVTTDVSAPVKFYIHKTNDVLSQFPEPKPEEIGDFEAVVLPSRPLAEIIAEHGAPYYVKVDIEHYDRAIIDALFSEGFYPPFISAESHHIDVFCSLVALGRYKAFKLVEGRRVAKDYKNVLIQTDAGPKPYRFPHHAAGPFGDDVRGGWMDADAMFELLSRSGLGWKDIHATNTDVALSMSKRELASKGKRAALMRSLKKWRRSGWVARTISGLKSRPSISRS
jgi:FkbM family methyltransferase